MSKARDGVIDKEMLRTRVETYLITAKWWLNKETDDDKRPGTKEEGKREEGVMG